MFNIRLGHRKKIKEAMGGVPMAGGKGGRRLLCRPPGKKKKNHILAYVFLAPTFILLIVFTFYPFLRSIYLTFFIADKLGHARKFVGLGNYIRMLTNGEVLTSVHDTLIYASMIGVGTFSLALVLAYLCVDRVKGSRGYQTMFSLPLAIATVPIAAVSTYVFGLHGLLNNVLGTHVLWLGGSTKLVCVALIVCWCNCGSSFIYLLVGFRNVSDDLVECSMLDGAGPVTRFFKIYLPIASPQIFYVVFLNILSAFKSFTMIKVLFGTNEKGLKVLASQIYRKGIIEGRFEAACVYSLVLCVLIFLVTRIQLMLEKRTVFYQ